MSPFVRGFQDHMTSWMSSLINQQDGCIRLVAQQSNLGHQRQVEHAIAMRAPQNSSSDRDHVQFLVRGRSSYPARMHSWNIPRHNVIVICPRRISSPNAPCSAVKPKTANQEPPPPPPLSTTPDPTCPRSVLRLPGSPTFATTPPLKKKQCPRT